MPLWDKAGTKPIYVPDLEQRNVIATNQGWVQRRNFTDTHGNVRTKDEVLVHIGDLDEAAGMNFPAISEIYFANSSGGTTPEAGTQNRLYIVFDEPMFMANLTSTCTFNLVNANAVDSADDVLICTSNNQQDSLTNANNTLVLLFTANNAGAYKLGGQTGANADHLDLWSLNSAANTEFANLTVTDTFSNTTVFSVI